jgi:predicted RNase H-like HicB family nuclease
MTRTLQEAEDEISKLRIMLNNVVGSSYGDDAYIISLEEKIKHQNEILNKIKHKVMVLLSDNGEQQDLNFIEREGVEDLDVESLFERFKLKYKLAVLNYTSDLTSNKSKITPIGVVFVGNHFKQNILNIIMVDTGDTSVDSLTKKIITNLPEAIKQLSEFTKNLTDLNHTFDALNYTLNCSNLFISNISEEKTVELLAPNQLSKIVDIKLNERATPLKTMNLTTSALRDLDQYVTFRRGWDGYDAVQFQPEIIKRAEFIIQMLSESFLRAQICPNEMTVCPIADGRIDLEVESKNGRLTMTLEPDSDEVNIVFNCNNYGPWHEERVAVNSRKLKRWIYYLTGERINADAGITTCYSCGNPWTPREGQDATIDACSDCSESRQKEAGQRTKLRQPVVVAEGRYRLSLPLEKTPFQGKLTQGLGKYTALYERDEDGVWTAELREAPQCHVYGYSFAEVSTKIREALALWFDDAATAEIRNEVEIKPIQSFQLQPTSENAQNPSRVFRIHIDRAHYNISNEKMTGAQLRELMPALPIGIDRDLFEIVSGERDRKIEDTDIVEIWNGKRFFTLPSHINSG